MDGFEVRVEVVLAGEGLAVAASVRADVDLRGGSRGRVCFRDVRFELFLAESFMPTNPAGRRMEDVIVRL